MSYVLEQRRKVLVVDDDEEYLELTARLLRGAGYEVLTRSHSIGTLEAVTAQGPDMVLMDVNIPRLDGDRLTWAIRHCTGYRPIVALHSGMNAAALEKRAAACGADAVIPKGLLPQRFLEQVARAFARGG
jgi:CheY-like chemotaxis protein